MPPPRGVSRREFLNRVAVLAALAAAYPQAALAQRRAAPVEAADGWLAQDPWKTLAAVQEHLFPAGEDTPGAREIGAPVYLRRAIENPDADREDRAFLFDGVGWLNELAEKRHGEGFAALDEPSREALLRDIEESRAGRDWLSLMLTYLLEALLADPVYGGNRAGAGWQWLAHQPGFPAPTADKTWYRLAARRGGGGRRGG